MAKKKRAGSSSKPKRRRKRAARKVRPVRSRPVTQRQVMALLQEMSLPGGEAAGRSRAGGAAALAAIAADKKAVTFSCSNPQCLVGITVGSINIVFTGTGGSLFPAGSFVAHWRVKGSGAFTITSAGATLSAVASTAPDAGLASLLVGA